MERLLQATQYDKGRRDMRLRVGDLVLRRTHLLGAAQGFAASLEKKWQGTYRISARASSLSYRSVRCEAGDECGPIHINGFKRFFDRSECFDISQIPAHHQCIATIFGHDV